MKITYASATMRFDIEVVGCYLALTIYRQPDKIQLGHHVPYKVAGLTFLSAGHIQITHLFSRDPTVFVLGRGALNSHTHRCRTVAEALSGGSRLYHGLVALDKLMEGDWISGA